VIHRNRVSWISIEDRRVVKQQTLAWRPAAAVVVGDYLVVASPTSRVLVLNSDGDSVVSFGLPDPPPNDDVLRLAASGDSAIWVGSVFRYRLDLIRLDGSHIAGFERKPS